MIAFPLRRRWGQWLTGLLVLVFLGSTWRPTVPLVASPDPPPTTTSDVGAAPESPREIVPPNHRTPPPTFGPIVERLGHPSFRIREAAMQELIAAGDDAYDAVQAALGHPNPEIARRAERIWADLRWGIEPRLPLAMREKIHVIRQLHPQRRLNEIVSLTDWGEISFGPIRRIFDQFTPEERATVLGDFHLAVRTVVAPKWIQTGKSRQLSQLLRFSLDLGYSEVAAEDLAWYWYLTRQLDSGIAEYQNQLASAIAAGDRPREQQLQRILVALFMIAKQPDAARRAAERADDADLLSDLLWELGDFGALVNRPLTERGRAGNEAAQRLAFARLAGNQAEVQRQIDLIREALNQEGLDYREGRSLLEALLLNQQHQLALDALAGIPDHALFLMDLYSVQLRYIDAWRLLKQEAVATTRLDMELRRAKMLQQLGEREAARQVLIQQFQAFLATGSSQYTLVDLLKAEKKFGLTGLLDEHLARGIEWLDARQMGESADALLEVAFDELPRDLLRILWRSLRTNARGDTHANSIAKLRKLLQGSATDQASEWLADLYSGSKAPLRAAVVRAELARIAKQPAEQEQALQEATRAFKPLAEDWQRFGEFLLKQRRPMRAAECFAKARDIAPTNVECALLEALAWRDAGDFERAKRCEFEAILLPLGNEGSRAELATEARKLGMIRLADEQAELILQRGRYRHFSYGNLLNRSARAAIARGDFATASRNYQRSILGLMRTNASFVDDTAYLSVPQAVEVNAIRDLLQKRQWDAALPRIRESQAALPGNLDLVISVVPLLDAAGKQADADAIYQRTRDVYAVLLKDYPNSGWLHNSLAWMAVNCNRDLPQALAHAKDATRLEPNSVGYRDTLAEAYFRLGKTAEAIREIQECLKKEPNRRYYQLQLQRFQAGDRSAPIPDENDD
ncbi:tetratricopeptide repeat protein [Tuwongella immobilis]|uniref:Tetratricopeptide repeat protein n=1 Tax=Tuwongella immobilis TaxID=692036 RepID=A0A6C2YTE5_9BACT|nr:hypothetical protein [Tuwongella immobilis]VIP04185.1 o-linked c transferase : O-linked GlcNAc transferase OS=Rhodopirellula maiorica SM1 GN=RMSM_02574 PE=4 SV=1: TPR_2 [Tuwongella immobilis]VTS05734.1 o-linked c transferase : O-linked GlcNAc transferase OS=Rhodopirellula maiorica SM1 GN=RMSM_02574 PE=4 SV=1: TPR_2 [Tuwongella immobilis]